MMANDNDNSFLTQEELEQIDMLLKKKPEQDLTFLDVFPIKQLSNKYAETGFYYVKDTTERGASLLRKLSEAKKITIAKDKVTYSVYLAANAYELEQKYIETSRSVGQPIDLDTVEDATRGVNEKLNELAYIGDSTFGVPGVLEATGVTLITGTDLDGMTDVASEFIGYFNSLPVEFRTRYNYTLVLADQEWKKINKRGNTYNDKSVATIITEAIPNLTISMPEQNLDSGTTLSSGSTVTDGTALLVPNNSNAIFMPIGHTPENNSMYYSDIKIVKGTVSARAGPMNIIFPTSLGIIVGLNG